MNTDRLEGKWKQAMGRLREKWGKLTEDDLEMIGGKRDQLIGRLQERYGIAKEDAEKQAGEFIDSLGDEPSEKKRAARRGSSL